MINESEKIPLNIVGGSVFGRYPKISSELTYNMFISDGWLVNYAGYALASNVILSNLISGEGRALYHSVRGNFAIAVVNYGVFKIGPNLVPIAIGSIETNNGEVFIDENLVGQICIVDGQDAWIYDWASTQSLTKQNLTFNSLKITPGYVCYHNTFFLIASTEKSNYPENWYAYTGNTITPTVITFNSQFSLQTKPDSAIAVKRIPGRGNNVMVFGSTVAEMWTQVGGTANYQRVSSMNIDSGCVSVSTIAASEDKIVWLAQNESNAPSIMVSDGSSVSRISTDGIDYVLQSLMAPTSSTAFFFRQDGHLFYQITFFDARDNLTLVYDFNTGLFFNITDEKSNYHPARQVIYFNEVTYFISLRSAAMYSMGTNHISYKYTLDPDDPGEDIPRSRICKTVRRDDASRFRVGYATFVIEQGVNNNYLTNSSNCTCFIITEEGDPIITEDGDFIILENCDCETVSHRPRVDMTFSKNGNQTFSSVVSRDLNPQGKHRNRINWYRMGYANEFTAQYRFWGLQRFVVHDGILEIY